MKNILLAICCLVSLISYGQNKKQLIIHGRFAYDVPKERNVYLKKMNFFANPEGINIDSSNIGKNGNFGLKATNTDESIIYIISFTMVETYYILKNKNEEDLNVILNHDYYNPIEINSPINNSLYQLSVDHFKDKVALDSIANALYDQGKNPAEDNDFQKKEITFKKDFKNLIFSKLENNDHPGMAMFLTYFLFQELKGRTMSKIDDNLSGDIEKTDKADLKKAGKIILKKFSGNKQVQSFCNKMSKELEKPF